MVQNLVLEGFVGRCTIITTAGLGVNEINKII